LPLSVFERSDVITVPLDVRLGARDPELLRSLSGDEFWQLVKSTDDLPTTAAPSPGAFKQAFEQLHDSGCEEIVCITISSELSATFQSATVGASTCDFAMAVTDSRNATIGQGLLVLEALGVREEADSIDDLVSHLNAIQSQITTMGTLDTLENLRRGGRIGTAQAFFGSLLSIKPIIEIRHGRVEGESKQRTRGRSLSYLADQVRSAGPLQRLGVVHALADDVTSFVDRLDGIDSTEPLIISTMGPVIGAHTGIGTIGVAFQRRSAVSPAR
jgi:DegV family protein with EDD domain